VSSQRDVIDYALQRRALLGDVASGRRAQAEACDAHPHLLLAAKHYGTPSPDVCPVCERHCQQHVRYVFGAALGNPAIGLVIGIALGVALGTAMSTMK